MRLGFESTLSFFRAPAHNNDIILPPNRGHLAETPKCPLISFLVFPAISAETLFILLFQDSNTTHILEACSSSNYILHCQEPSTLLCTLTPCKQNMHLSVSHLKTKQNKRKQKPLFHPASMHLASPSVYSLHSLLRFTPSMNYTPRSCLSYISPLVIGISLWIHSYLAPLILCPTFSWNYLHFVILLHIFFWALTLL